MLRIAICDDDRADAERIRTAIMKSLEIAGEPYSCQIFQSGKTLEYEVEDGQFFDLLFLDIELGGEDGFVLAEHLQGRLPAALLIFVSSHEKYVYDSFNYTPFVSCRWRTGREWRKFHWKL